MTRSVFRTPQPQRLSVAVLAVLCAVAPAAFAETAADPTNLDKVVVKGERAEGYSVRRTSAGTRFDLAPREIRSRSASSATSASKIRTSTTSSTCWPTPPA